MESKFKVGEKVLSATGGLGVVVRILEPQTDRYYPVVVKFENHSRQYDLKGRRYNYDKYPDIYKDGDIHPLLNVPVRIPKQRVKKELDAFVNIYNSDIYAFQLSDGKSATVWATESSAETFGKPEKCICTVPAKITFEVEE